jgi:hypothetical protein
VESGTVQDIAAQPTGLGTAEIFGASYELHRATRRS